MKGGTIRYSTPTEQIQIIFYQNWMVTMSSAKDLRDVHQQKRYRESSKAKNKKSKDVSHTVSCRIASEALTVPSSSVNETKKIKGVINNSENFRMTSRKRNRVDHEKADKELIKKSKTGEKLTQTQETRARQQARVIQKKQDDLPKAAYSRGQKFYGKLETKSGRKVWDKRKDHKNKK